MFGISAVADYIREYGYLNLLKIGIKRVVYDHRKDIYLSLSLEDPIPDIKPLGDIRIRRATLADYGELICIISIHRYPRRGMQIKRWIENKECFFVALVNKRIIGYTCVSFKIPKMNPNLIKVLDLKDDDAWGSDALVVPRHRARAVYPALAIEAMKCAKAAGYRRILCQALSDNYPARSSHKRIGLKEIYEIDFLRILLFNRTNIKSPVRRLPTANSPKSRLDV